MPEIFLLLHESLPFLISLTGLFSLLVGSFLNVVIYRMPIMLENAWRQECVDNFGGDAIKSTPLSKQPFNLVIPRSACPHCGHQISAWENIPILSYLFLRGRCVDCKTIISWQYPFVEAFVAIISMLVAWHFGFGWQLLGALILTWTLITLAGIDIKSLLLPDNITLPLLWLGIIFNFNDIYVSLSDSVLGAILGYLSLWTVFHLFKFITGKEGMGYGDFKLLAVLGAWGGWQILPIVILLSSLVGAIFGGLLLLMTKKDTQTPIPFGPWLALAGWLAFLWGDLLTTAWLQLFQFT